MEENLIKMAKLGDKNAFVDLINMYQRKLYFIALSKVEKEEDVKDVIQDTLLQVYTNISTIKNVDSFNGWISQILLNNCNNVLRKRNRTPCFYEEIKNNIEYSTEDGFIDIDYRIDIFSVMKLFSNDEKDILILHFIEGYTTKEISKILNINENTIRTKVRRMRERFKEIYAQEDDGAI